MSKAAAKKFVQRLETDAELRNKVKRVTSKVTEVGKEHGHNFTYEELRDALKEKWGVPQGREGEADPHTCFSEPPGF
jgi:predicted ribosomally synthesized peptide with nif11-like leader